MIFFPLANKMLAKTFTVKNLLETNLPAMLVSRLLSCRVVKPMKFIVS